MIPVCSWGRSSQLPSWTAGLRKGGDLIGALVPLLPKPWFRYCASRPKNWGAGTLGKGWQFCSLLKQWGASCHFPTQLFSSWSLQFGWPWFCTQQWVFRSDQLTSVSFIGQFALHLPRRCSQRAIFGGAVCKPQTIGKLNRVCSWGRSSPLPSWTVGLRKGGVPTGAPELLLPKPWSRCYASRPKHWGAGIIVRGLRFCSNLQSLLAWGKLRSHWGAFCIHHFSYKQSWIHFGVWTFARQRV